MPSASVIASDNYPARTLGQADSLATPLALLGPRWSAWVLQTLQQQPMRVSEINLALPWLSPPLLHQRLKRLSGDGLLARTRAERYAPYALSSGGAALRPVQKVLIDWSREYLPTEEPIADTERIERAVTLLQPRGTMTVVGILAERGSTGFEELRQATAGTVPTGSMYGRLRRMHDDGLVTRTGPSRGAAYTLTSLGISLGPVTGALAEWSSQQPGNHPTSASRAAAFHSTSRPRQADGMATGSRSAAATARSSRSSTALLFSHPEVPQPLPAATAPASPPFRVGSRAR